ncbi:MAG: 4Fe-4S dicluster domain-containing protein [bacterium]|nr:4Fe-4S dicluster domain-containing protein [bacterium]
MAINRRFFIKTGLASLLAPAALQGQEKETEKESIHVGCLADTTLCIGCRKCEEACNRSNKLRKPVKPFSDKSVFHGLRRPTENAFTVVNRYDGIPSADQANIKNTHCKVQCMHCLTPSCVSACVVGAMVKQTDGSIVYNRDICLGCRYCMVACPFEIPAYEYTEPLIPRVRKCEFCADYGQKKGANPACAASCPTEALVFGKRKELLDLARQRIKTRPDRYIKHIYGENEMGGTSWLYLVGRPAPEIGLLKLANQSPAVLTEKIQHGIFKFGILPLAAYGLLSAVMWRNRKKEEPDKKETPSDDENQSQAGDDKGGAL